MDTYHIELTVRPEFSAFTVGRLVADAMAGLPDEPMDYSFDPYWDGSAEVVLPLTYSGPGIVPTEVGSIKIYPANTFVCHVCGTRQFEADRLTHGRTHVETGYVLDDEAERELNGPMTGDQDGGPYSEGDYLANRINKN